jgi:hypothetical protein
MAARETSYRVPVPRRLDIISSKRHIRCRRITQSIKKRWIVCDQIELNKLLELNVTSAEGHDSRQAQQRSLANDSYTREIPTHVLISQE